MRKFICSLLIFVSLVIPSYGNIRLFWIPNSEPNIANYAIYESSTGLTNSWTKTLVGKTNSAVVTTGSNSGLYLYVTAINDGGQESDPSSIITIYTGAWLPSISLLTTNVTQTNNAWKIQLSWTDLNKGAYNFTNYYVKIANLTTGITNTCVTPNTSFTLTNLPFADYKIYVVTTNFMNHSSFAADSFLNLSSPIIQQKPPIVDGLSVISE